MFHETAVCAANAVDLISPILLIPALGVKEVWEVPESVFKKGYIQHTLGWPLQSKIVGQDTFGGSFLYHMEPNVRKSSADHCLLNLSCPSL